jgi:hypothetical protein
LRAMVISGTVTTSSTEIPCAGSPTVVSSTWHVIGGRGVVIAVGVGDNWDLRWDI